MSYALTFAALSDIGRVRKRNEDSFLLLPDLGAATVADGMGAHPGGDVASRLAVEAVESELRHSLPGPLPPDAVTTGEVLREVLGTAARKAHETVRAGGEEDASLQEMGCTLTSLVVDPSSGVYALAQVGDSRLYRLREAGLQQLSHDHTWVQGLVDTGKLSAARARNHPLGHVLTQCIGSPEPPTPDIDSGEIRAGDVYLLCSDGLVGMVDDAEVRDILREHLRSGAGTEALESAAQALVDAANEHGGTDNITVALVGVE